ncbi:MAG: T9SS type A sorting domain-containing protein [Ignavibacteriales bacterium]|nr:T9SS type A sorting domain-containing protein [Ignavibacteriales bacterium]
MNTATVPDTIRSLAFVQLRGDTPPLNWDSTSPVFAIRINGDYWKATVRFSQNDTIHYKFFVNGGRNKFSGVEGAPERMLITGTTDSTLPVQFVFGTVQDSIQYWKPYFDEPDSIEILFRVNMERQEDFDTNTMRVGVRGNFPPFIWGGTYFLKKEPQHVNPMSREYNGEHFWSGVIRLPRTLTDSIIYFRYVIHNAGDVPTANPLRWEDGISRTCGYPDIDPDGGNNPPRIFKYNNVMNDSTLAWKYWGDSECPRPIVRQLIFAVQFVVDLSEGKRMRVFDDDDSIAIRYYSDSFGNNLRKRIMKPMPATNNLYTFLDSFFLSMPGLSDVHNMATDSGKLYYRYVILKNGIEFDETYNLITLGGLDSLEHQWRSQIYNRKGTNQFFQRTDTSTRLTYQTNIPRWFVTLKPQRDVVLTLSCDLRPAYYQLAKGDTLFDSGQKFSITNKDSIYHWGVSVNTGYQIDNRDWIEWGNQLYSDTLRKMFDDGTHGDSIPLDHIYTQQFRLYKDSIGTGLTRQKFFKFSIRGYDNEGGKDIFNSFRHHFILVNDSSGFHTAREQFGSETPWIYTEWNYSLHKPMSVKMQSRSTEIKFSLDQNYPNPFNPSTTISYSVPMTGFAMLRIFDMLGREVKTILNGKVAQGTYTATWHADEFPSGIYFYQFQCGTFVDTKKMVLLK